MDGGEPFHSGIMMTKTPIWQSNKNRDIVVACDFDDDFYYLYSKPKRSTASVSAAE